MVFLTDAQKKPAEMIYCPLTKKLQPVKASETRQKPLQNICANDSEKTQFLADALGKNSIQILTLDENRFENLVFDYFQNGSSVFKNLPPLPDLPQKSYARTFSPAIGFSSKKSQPVWKLKTEVFSFSIYPRPPDSVRYSAFEVQTFRQLEIIPRQIAPRAPPFSV